MSRNLISDEAKAWAVKRVYDAMEMRLKQKGPGSYASSHEVLGIITEEWKELIDAVQLNSMEDVDKELVDIAVGCVFAIACIRENGLEW